MNGPILFQRPTKFAEGVWFLSQDAWETEEEAIRELKDHGLMAESLQLTNLTLDAMDRSLWLYLPVWVWVDPAYTANREAVKADRDFRFARYVASIY